MEHWILNANGEPESVEDLMTWARWFETAGDARILKRDTFGEVLVSTVFLGLDHGFGHSSAPVLWESMIFGGPHDGEQQRYSTRDAALIGHAEFCALVTGEAQSPDAATV